MPEESAAQSRLSALSQTDAVNQLSVVSQTSGHTLFYDVMESEGKGQGLGIFRSNSSDLMPETRVFHTAVKLQHLR